MDYGMIGKIEKSKIYAEERDRIKFESLRVTLRGDNDSIHQVAYDNGEWNCDCSFFSTRRVCSHTMTMERVLADMVKIGVVTY
jgi:hypothetical protein